MGNSVHKGDMVKTNWTAISRINLYKNETITTSTSCIISNLAATFALSIIFLVPYLGLLTPRSSLLIEVGL